MNIYKCMFQGHFGPGALDIYVQSDRELTKRDVFQVLHAAYANKQLDLTSPGVPELQNFLDAVPVQADEVKGKHTLAIWDDIQTILFHTWYEEKNCYRVFLLDMPVKFPNDANTVTNLLREVAKDWTYENKKYTCTWNEFLSVASDEFLLRYGIARNHATPCEVSKRIELKDEPLVETQTIVIAFRDDEYVLSGGFEVTLPAHVLTKADLQGYQDEVAAKACGVASKDMSVKDLLSSLASKDGYEARYGLSIKRLDVHEAFEFNLSTPVRKD